MNQRSEVRVTSSTFHNCTALTRGGVFASVNYIAWTITNSSFAGNKAGSEGSDIYLQDAMSPLLIEDSYFRVKENTPVIVNRRSNFDIVRSHFQGDLRHSRNRPIIMCSDCQTNNIHSSTFSSVAASSVIEAIYDGAWLHQEPYFRIEGNEFSNIRSSSSGGAIFANWLGRLEIIGNTFKEIKAENAGCQGGAIYSEVREPNTSVVIESNSFQNCRAEQGGAIKWNHYGPLIQHNSFISNEADVYGNQIGSYGRALLFLDQSIGSQFIAGHNLNRMAVKGSTELVIQNIRSGSDLPPLYVGAVDKYGQIVSNLHNGLVYSRAVEKLNEGQVSSTFEPLLSNLNTNEWINGAIELTNITLKGEPGKVYEIIFTSPIIDSSLPDTKKFLKETGRSEVNIRLRVHFRHCIEGEAFQSDGECVECPPGTYLNQAPRFPKECASCPNNAICYGGNMMGPKSGFWRSGPYSLNFLPCLRAQGCLETESGQNYDPKGRCAPGYFGVLCSSCETGFTRSQQFVCSKCPSEATNLIILVVVLICFIALFAILIKCTLKYQTKVRSVFTVYFKILTSHFQLLMLVSSFDFDWPKEVQSFLNSSQSVADTPQEFFSFDCFIQTSLGRPIKRYFLYLISYFSLPLFAALIISIFWHLKIRRDPGRRLRRIIASLLICFFLLHPSITRSLLQSFNCTDIDGESYLLEELSEKCWEGDQLKYSLSLGLIGFLLFSVGIPLFSFFLLYRNRDSLSSIQIQEKYGFLYKGFTKRSYYWEIAMHGRKILIAFVSIFLTSQGTMVQSLVLLSIMCFFIYATLKVHPFEHRSANQLEIVSLIALIVTVYCGIFYLTARKADSGFQVGKDFSLQQSQKWFLFFMIIISNGAFFGLVFYRILQSLRRKLRRNHRKCFIWLCLCCKQGKFRHEARRESQVQENEKLIQDVVEIQNVLKLHRSNLESNTYYSEKLTMKLLCENILLEMRRIRGQTQKKLQSGKRASLFAQIPRPFQSTQYDEDGTGGSTQRPLNQGLNSKRTYLRSQKISVKGVFQTLPEQMMSGRETERRGPSLRFAWAQEDSLAHSGFGEITPQATQDERFQLEQSQEPSIRKLSSYQENSFDLEDQLKKHLKTQEVDKEKSPTERDTRRSRSNYPSVLAWNLK